jgi:hypothetical protein
MIAVYNNYPRKRCCIHLKSSVEENRKFSKNEQRIISITKDTISMELNEFMKKRYIFRSAALYNDMWLEIDFDDRNFEIAIARHIIKILGKILPTFQTTEFTTTD